MRFGLRPHLATPPAPLGTVAPERSIVSGLSSLVIQAGYCIVDEIRSFAPQRLRPGSARYTEAPEKRITVARKNSHHAGYGIRPGFGDFSSRAPLDSVAPEKSIIAGFSTHAGTVGRTGFDATLFSARSAYGFASLFKCLLRNGLREKLGETHGQ